MFETVVTSESIEHRVKVAVERVNVFLLSFFYSSRRLMYGMLCELLVPGFEMLYDDSKVLTKIRIVIVSERFKCSMILLPLMMENQNMKVVRNYFVYLKVFYLYKCGFVVRSH